MHSIFHKSKTKSQFMHRIDELNIKLDKSGENGAKQSFDERIERIRQNINQIQNDQHTLKRDEATSPMKELSKVAVSENKEEPKLKPVVEEEIAVVAVEETPHEQEEKESPPESIFERSLNHRNEKGYFQEEDGADISSVREIFHSIQKENEVDR